MKIKMTPQKQFEPVVEKLQMGHLSWSIFEVRHKCTTRQSTSDYHTATFRAHVKGVKRDLSGDFWGIGGPRGPRGEKAVGDPSLKSGTNARRAKAHRTITLRHSAPTLKGQGGDRDTRRVSFLGALRAAGAWEPWEPWEPWWCSG